MIPRKRLVGVAASMLLFAMFGVFAGQIVVALGGVGFTDTVDGLVTGPTPVPIVFTDHVVTLPAVVITHEVFGLTLSLSGFSLAQVSIGGGAALGLLVGVYYLMVFAYEDAASDDGASSE